MDPAEKAGDVRGDMDKEQQSCHGYPDYASLVS